MILVIDNYDSFTFNLVQALEAAGAAVRVVRNDAIDRTGIEALADDEAADLNGIVISPGPGDPDDAGVSMDAVRVAGEREIPLLGVCLGMQSMAQAYGGSIVRAPTLVHGEAAAVTHDGAGLLEGNIHDFRRTAIANWLTVHKLTPNDVQVLAGHADLMTTLDVYAECLKDQSVARAKVAVSKTRNRERKPSTPEPSTR